MGEKELFNFGDKDLNINSLLNNITSNLQSYADYYSNNITDSKQFFEKVDYIKNGIKDGSITTNGLGVYYDANGKLSKDDKLMNNALHFVDIIAKAQSKKERSLTKSEIDKKHEERMLRKAEAERQKEKYEQLQKEIKPDFTPQDGWSVAKSFAGSFNQNGQIPYDLLQQLVTVDDEGKEVYTALHKLLDKNFDYISNQLSKFNGTESYINSINLFKNALKDGELSPQDRFLGMELGFQNNELDKLNALITYKVKSESTKPAETPVAPELNLNLEKMLEDYEEDKIGWEVLGPIGLDIVSIVDPEPISATIAGLGSDLFGVWQDVRNGGDFHWGQHGFNIGATALGAIPYLGDAGNVGKVGTKIVNASVQLNKQLSKASDILKKISKYHVMVGGATVGALAAMDLTDEDSLILDAGQKAVEAIKNGEITKENIALVGNGLAIAFQLRKGLKKFRSLDPSVSKSAQPTKISNAVQNRSGYRDELINRIKTKNKSIAQEDLNEINNALDQLTNKGMLTKVRQKMGGTNNELIKARQVLRSKGNFTETEIDDIIKQVLSYSKGGIIKASEGVKIPWRLNFNGSTHQIDDIYKLFTDNILSYDAKQMADALNELEGDDYKSLHFGGADNSLGFKNWNTTFNKSGLNNLFGYNENKSDYLGITTRSRNDFVNNLKNKGNITTGNGTLSWNPTDNKWEYADWVDPNNSNVKASDIVAQNDGSQSNVEDPGIVDLTLKDINLRKPTNFNPNGIINSLVGYAANESANKKKHKIQQEIPIYLEVVSPEKAFKTAYTYDLEKAKNEIMAEANSIKSLTSDVNDYYAARNEAIKNARAYSTKLDTEINDRIHQVASDNKDIAFENAVRRVENVNTNAKYRHDWTVEQKLGDIDFVDAANASFQNLNKEFKHYAVTDADKKEKITDTYVAKHMLTGIKTNPSNYINGWTKHHDLIWYKGLNNQLETDQERIEYQQLLSLVNQAYSNIFAKYENISYPEMDVLHANDVITESYNPNKHGVAPKGSKGIKIDKKKIGNFINKLK